MKGAPLRGDGRGGEFPIVRSRWLAAELDDLMDGRDVVETMFRYALGHPSAHTFINGTKDLEHLRVNIRATVLGPLEPDHRAAIRDRVLAAVARE